MWLSLKTKNPSDKVLFVVVRIAEWQSVDLEKSICLSSLFCLEFKREEAGSFVTWLSRTRVTQEAFPIRSALPISPESHRA